MSSLCATLTKGFVTSESNNMEHEGFVHDGQNNLRRLEVAMCDQQHIKIQVITIVCKYQIVVACRVA